MQITMKGLPDEVQSDLVPGPGATLGSVVSRLRSLAGRSRRVVSEILLDGEVLTAERESREVDRPVSEFARLEVAVSSPEDLLGAIASGLSTALEVLEGGTRQTARSIRAGLSPREGLSRIADDLSFVIGARADCARADAAFSGRPHLVSPAATRLEAVVRELLSSLEDDDPVRVADSLEHELAPTLGELREEIQGRAEPGGAGAGLKGGGAGEGTPEGGG